MGKQKYVGAVVSKQALNKYKKPYIFCISNIKGGVGKSTTAQAFCEMLVLAGKEVLGIDLDLQKNFASTAGVEELNEEEQSVTLRQVFDYIKEGNQISKAIAHKLIKKSNGGYSVIHVDIDMLDFDKDFADYEHTELLLKQVVDTIRDEYDFIVIDTPPNLDALTRNAYCVSDEIVIPMLADRSSTEGLGLLLFLYSKMKEQYNPGLTIRGFFFNIVEDGANPRDIISAMKELSVQLDVPMLQTYIKNAKIYNKIRDNHLPLSSSLLKNPQMAQYLLLFNEVTRCVVFKLRIIEV